MFEAKMSPIWACAAVLALGLTACGDDSSGSGGSSAGSGGASGSGGDTSSPSSSSGTPTSSSGTPSSNSAVSTGEGPGPGPGPGSGGGGPGSGGAGPGSGGAGPGSGGGGTGGSGTGGGGTGGGGDACEVRALFNEPACDLCAQANCCDEVVACDADIDACIADGSPTGDALFACTDDNCLAECEFDNASCDLVAFQNTYFGFCIDQSTCCDELSTCLEDETGCFDCLNGDDNGVCDDFLTCADADCGDLENPYAICDSGLALPGDYPTATCLNDSCCEEFTDCTGGDPDDPDAVDACIDCLLTEGGGILCDAAIACAADQCGFGL